MPTPLQTFDALQTQANLLGRGRVIRLNKINALSLRGLDVIDLKSRGVSEVNAEHICEALWDDTEPFRPLQELLGIQIQVEEHAEDLVREHPQTSL